jgi:DNA-binding IclR family transcriptional regulator
MRRLGDLIQETLVLHIRIEVERVCLEELPSFQQLKYKASKRFIAPIYTGSAGKVFFSELGDDELEVLLKNIECAQVGPNTIADREVLTKEIRER